MYITTWSTRAECLASSIAVVVVGITRMKESVDCAWPGSLRRRPTCVTWTTFVFILIDLCFQWRCCEDAHHKKADKTPDGVQKVKYRKWLLVYYLTTMNICHRVKQRLFSQRKYNIYLYYNLYANEREILDSMFGTLWVKMYANRKKEKKIFKNM